MTDYGTLETRDDGTCVLRYERRLRHPVEKVWAALTEPREIEAWWARAAELELTEGGRARFEWLNGPAIAQGHITRLERLTVTHQIPDEHLTEVLAGWHIHLDFLEDALDGRRVDWADWPRDRFDVHHRRYEASMRPIS